MAESLFLHAAPNTAAVHTRIPIAAIACMHGAAVAFFVVAEYCCLRLPPINVLSGITSNWVINNNNFFIYKFQWKKKRIHDGAGIWTLHYTCVIEKDTSIFCNGSHTHASHASHTSHTRHSTGWWSIVGFRGIHHHAFSRS